MRGMCVLFGIVLALAGVPGMASAAEPAPATPTPAHAPLPASLVALEQKMEELKITSMRFSAQSSITVPHADGKLPEFPEAARAFGDLWGRDDLAAVGQLHIQPVRTSLQGTRG